MLFSKIVSLGLQDEKLTVLITLLLGNLCKMSVYVATMVLILKLLLSLS